MKKIIMLTIAILLMFGYQQAKADIPIEVAVAVSKQVDSKIKYREDEWVDPNFWQKYVDRKGANHIDDSTPEYGDCDDYAASKRKILLDMGYSAKDMRLTSVPFPGQYLPTHMVLLIKTERGWYALDMYSYYKFHGGPMSVSMVDGKWYNYKTYGGELSKYSNNLPPKGWEELCDRKEKENVKDYDCDVVKPSYGIHIEFIR